MSLIINADDLGYSSHRDAGIFECFEKKCLTSASLIVNGPTSESAARKAVEMGLFLGLHLNLTEGTPLTEVPLLTGDDGEMYYKDNFMALDAPNTCPELVVQETRAQLDQFKVLTGYSAKHVDGHQHVHIYPGMAELLAPVFQEYGVLSTRIPDEDLSKFEWVGGVRRKKYEMLFSTMVLARLTYKKYGVRAPECFVGLALGGLSLGQERLDSCMKETFGTIELMVHPGHGGVLTGGSFSDSFDVSDGRLHECEQLQTLSIRPTLCDWSVYE